MKRQGLAWLALLMVSATWGFAQDAELSDKQKERLVHAIGKKLDKKAYAFETDFSQWSQFVELHQAEIDTAKSKDELAIALGEALGEFKLSHLGIFSPDTLRLKRHGKRVGMGITIHPIGESGGLISLVLADSPAERCGLQKGDFLQSIDGEPLTDLSQLAGEIGQIRRLEWLRDNKQLSCEIEYGSFNLSEPSSLEWLREDVALIRIQSFQYRFYKTAKINRYFREARKAKAVVLDLRNNRGGLSLYSRHLASKLTPRSQVFAYHAKKARNGAYQAVHPLPFSKPYEGQLVVLVDALSASAADIIPAFVSESGRGTVIGQKTAGALQLARTYPLPYGFRIYVPIAELLTPNKNRLENSGFVPEVELTLEETIDDSFIFSQALSVIDRESTLESTADAR